MSAPSTVDSPDLVAGELHALVLAGGAGRRLEALTRRLFGEPIPKQFCRFGGGRSLLEQTIDRIAPLVPPRRVTVVVDRTQTQRARLQLAAYRGLELVEQPCDRGTAAGVLLPLLHVLARDPHATVLLAASDHGVADERTFVATLAAARRAVDDDPSRVVLIAAEPAAPNTDYGWIVRVGVDDDVEAVDAVERFVEKPLLADAEALFASGRALWNTMILVARGAALVDRMRERLPKLCRELESLVRGARRGAPIDVAAYQALPRASFSFDVLSGVAGLSVLALPSKAGWTDLGTETRLAAWLARRRRTPAEPMAQAG